MKEQANKVRAHEGKKRRGRRRKQDPPSPFFPEALSPFKLNFSNTLFLLFWGSILFKADWFLISLALDLGVSRQLGKRPNSR